MSSQNIDPHLIVGGYIGQTWVVAFRVHIVWSWFMKVGDLVEHVQQSWAWGIIVAVQTFEYEVYWMDGLRSWTRKATVVKKCP